MTVHIDVITAEYRKRLRTTKTLDELYESLKKIQPRITRRRVRLSIGILLNLGCIHQVRNRYQWIPPKPNA